MPNITHRSDSAAKSTHPVTPHTRVPNLIVDYILPLLTQKEMACLMYIVRRTYGFASADGERKTRDRISLTQFEHGIRSGDYVLDLGVGMARGSITTALNGLQAKGLVVIERHCSRCLWEPEDAAETTCVRCRRTMDKSYSLVTLTPKILIAFLNENDKKGRRWEWDAQVRRVRIGSAEVREPAPAEATPIDEYREQLWYPELADRIISQLQEARTRGTISEGQIIEHVYQPMIRMQERAAGNPALLKHALGETIGRSIPGQVRETERAGGGTVRKPNYVWHRYANAIIQRGHAGAPRRQRAGASPAGDARAVERGARDLLGRAFDLNEAGEEASARALLAELLGMVDGLAPLFGGAERTDALIRCAFKKGVSDIESAPHALAYGDYYPEWDWPADLTE